MGDSERFLLACDWDTSLLVKTNYATRLVVKELQLPRRPRKMKLTPSQKAIIIINEGKTILVDPVYLNITNAELFISDALCLAFSPDAKIVAFGDNGKTVSLRSLTDYSNAGSGKGHTGPVIAVDFSPSSSLLVSASVDNKFVVWTIPNMINQRSVQCDDMLSVLFFTDDLLYVASKNSRSEILVYDMEAIEWVSGIPVQTESAPSYLTRTPDPNTILCISDNISIAVSNGRLLSRKVHSAVIDSIYAVDSDTVLLGLRDKEAGLFGMMDGAVKRKFIKHYMKPSGILLYPPLSGMVWSVCSASGCGLHALSDTVLFY